MQRRPTNKDIVASSQRNLQSDIFHRLLRMALNSTQSERPSGRAIQRRHEKDFIEYLASRLLELLFRLRRSKKQRMKAHGARVNVAVNYTQRAT